MKRKTEADKPRERQRLYDAACYELAERFLEDPHDIDYAIGADGIGRTVKRHLVKLTKAEVAKAADWLAQVIQRSIEDNLIDCVALAERDRK